MKHKLNLHDLVYDIQRYLQTNTWSFGLLPKKDHYIFIFKYDMKITPHKNLFLGFLINLFFYFYFLYLR